MRIAVTGRTGQVVQSLLARAQAADVTVIPVGRPELGAPARRESVVEQPELGHQRVVADRRLVAVVLVHREAVLGVLEPGRQRLVALSGQQYRSKAGRTASRRG